MDAILLSAGIGSRTGLKYPKQFLSINGKPMLVYSLEVLRRCKEIDKIVVTCTQDYLEVYQGYIEKYHINDVHCVLGGSTRQESVRLLSGTSSKYTMNIIVYLEEVPDKSL